MIKNLIGIVGLGVVGMALYEYLSIDQELEFRLYDPAKEMLDDLTDCEAIFIAVPVPTLQNRSLDLSILRSTLQRLRAKPEMIHVPIFIKSTVLPGTCDALSEEFMMKVYAMPEFLTERTALTDMIRHDVLCGGADKISQTHKDIIASLFSDKTILWMTNKEAELSKYAHNCFAAAKVNYWNIIHALAKDLGCEYTNVLSGALNVSGLIERHHTMVPGPDGKTGFGGKCLPKDLRSLIGLLEERCIPCGSLKETEEENIEIFRGSET
jgi:UDPglucose 6-dehydrogenase